MEKKIPTEWEPICNIKVIDPDGWDRRNFAASWAEPITRDEFSKRAGQSTCLPFEDYQAWGK